VTIFKEDRQIATYRGRQTVKRIVKLSALGILAVVACLQHFVLTLPQPKAGLPTPTDGLVVPTGGQARIQEGLMLLHNRTAQRMLITGVGQSASKKALIRQLNLSAAQLAIFHCCVDIEKTAMDTKGNAIAASYWADANQFSTIRLVTANYHLPRAHLEFERFLPDRKITGWPVIPPDFQLDSWYLHWPAIRLLTKEYTKYLLARFWT
jgi:uncharacterized SAM-binding protein YcdF (DUF218 family)